MPLYRRLLLVVFSLITGAGCTLSAADEMTRAATLSWSSHYVFRGELLAGSSLQPAAEVTSGAFTGGLWANAALTRPEFGPREEVDLYGSAAFALPWAGWQAVPGITLYTFPEARRARGEYAARVEPSFALNATFAGVRFTPKLYYDFTREQTTAEINAAVALPLTQLGTELDLGATGGTFLAHSAAAGSVVVKSWANYWSVSATLPYQLPPPLSCRAAVGLSYSEGRDAYLKRGSAPRQSNPAARSIAALTLSLSWSL